MIDFKKLKAKEILTKKAIVKIEIQLNNCSKDTNAMQEKLDYLVSNASNKEISNLVVMLIREFGASTWEEGKCTITKVE